MSRILNLFAHHGSVGLAKEQRTAVRFPIAPEGCWNVNVVLGDRLHYATVHNLSLRGIGLLVEEEVRPGTTAEVELTGISGLNSCARSMDVVHVSRHSEGKYLVGGRFTLPLTNDVLDWLLREE